MESTEQSPVYRAKCTNHGSSLSNLILGQRHRRLNRPGAFPPHRPSKPRTKRHAHLSETIETETEAMEEQEEEEEEEVIVSLNVSASVFQPSSSSDEAQCSCVEVKCGYQLNCQTCRNAPIKQRAAEDAISDHPLFHSTNALYARLHTSNSDLKRLQEALVHKAGGHSSAIAIYEKSLGLSKNHAGVLSASASPEGDTVLMQLCTRDPKDSPSQKLLYGQILAFIRLYLELDQCLLFVRNKSGLNAMAVAGKTNKCLVTEYLVHLHLDLGVEPNETNQTGESLLHILAREGDACAETLESLLNMRQSVIKKRLFHYDVINQSQRTPLDEAITSASLFSTGKDRRVYQETVRLFYEVIEEDAAEMLAPTNANDHQN